MIASRDLTAAAFIETLGLLRHPEGGWYVQTFRDQAGGPRGHSTAIYYLLEKVIDRIGTVSGMPPKSGITMPGRRSNSALPNPVSPPRMSGSARTSSPARGRSTWSPPIGGNRPLPLGTGHSSAARSRRASIFPH